MNKFTKFSTVALLAVVLVFGLSGSTTVLAAGPLTVDLKTATPFAILAGEGITNVPTSHITGNVGLYPAAGDLYSGLTQAEVTGIIYSRNAAGPLGYVEDPALLLAAKNDLTAAYTDAAGRTTPTPTTLDSPELGGRTLTAGVYVTESTALNITAGAGPLVLDAQNDASAVFIFEGSDAEAGALTVNSGGTVSLINGASACNVFWRVYGATIGTSAVFKGNILALTSITVAGGVGTESNIEGRLLARNGNVTLDHTTVAVPLCTLATTSSPTTATKKHTLVTTPTPVASVTPAPVPQLPNTGNAPTKTNMAWYYAVIPAGILVVVLISFYVVRRKQRI